MIRMKVHDLRPDMILARSIYGDGGDFLLKADTVLNDVMIKKLRTLNISYVCIKENIYRISSEETSPIVQAAARTCVAQTISKSFNKYKLTNQLTTVSVQNRVNSIINDILVDKQVLAHTADLFTYDSSTFAHSVNVCSLSVILAMLRGHDLDCVREIAVGALLHDIGKTSIPLEVLNKATPLTPKEWQLTKMHSGVGLDLILKDVPALSDTCLNIIGEHHERFDGSGYPNHLKGVEINEFARIVSIADSFEALTHDRPYREACRLDAAYRIMVKENPGQFDDTMVNIFFNNISIYPVGTIVRLRSGLYAIVINKSDSLYEKPVLRVIADEKINYVNKTVYFEIKDNKESLIDRTATQQEIMRILRIIRAK